MPATDDWVRQLLSSDDPLHRDRLRFGNFVGTRFPYLYFETPKAACTTTKVHLWHLEGLGPIPYLSRVHERPAEDPRQSLFTVTEDRAIEALQGPSVFRFFVWRDPVRRLASAFWQQVQLNTDPDPIWGLWKKEIVNWMGLRNEADISFDHFVRFVCAVPDHQRNPHFQSQWRLLLADFVRYDRVVRIDHYAQDMEATYRAIGVPPSEWEQLGLRANESGSDTVHVSPLNASMIRSAFSKDYELLER